MANITVKNIPDDLYERLRATAKRNRRSINGEIIHCIERQLLPTRVPREELLDRIRRLRPRLGPPMTAAEIQAAIDEGRS